MITKYLLWISKALGIIPQKTILGILLGAVLRTFPELTPEQAHYYLLQLADFLFYTGILHWKLRDILNAK